MGGNSSSRRQHQIILCEASNLETIVLQSNCSIWKRAHITVVLLHYFFKRDPLGFIILIQMSLGRLHYLRVSYLPKSLTLGLTQTIKERKTK